MKNTQKSVARTIAAYFFFLLGSQFALLTSYFIGIRTYPSTPSSAAFSESLPTSPAPYRLEKTTESSPFSSFVANETAPEIVIEHRDITGLKREILSKRRRDERRAERAARPRTIYASHAPEAELSDEELASLVPVVRHEIFDSLSASGVRGTIMEEAKKHLGLQYIWGGSTPRGFDCSGFTAYVLAQKGVGVARSSRYQAQQGIPVDLAKAQTGDLIFFSKFGKGGRVTHVAMVVDNKKEGVYIIHSTRRGIVVDNLSESKYWKPKVLYAKDVISKG